MSDKEITGLLFLIYYFVGAIFMSVTCYRDCDKGLTLSDFLFSVTIGALIWPLFMVMLISECSNDIVVWKKCPKKGS